MSCLLFVRTYFSLKRNSKFSMTGDDVRWSPPDVSPDSYIFSSTKSGLPSNPLLMPSIGNGNIATVIYRDRIFMNGLYNGAGKQSHRAAIPALNLLKIRDTLETDVFSLNCLTGTFTHEQHRDGVRVVHSVYAHKTIPSLLVNHISMSRVESEEETLIQLQGGTDFHSPDLVMEATAASISTECFTGKILVRESEDYQLQISSIHIVMDKLPEEIELPSGQESICFTFIMSIDVTKERSLAQYTEGKRLAASSALYQLHCESWTGQWQESRIDVWSSDLLTTQTVYGCQYYLMSSLPSLSYYQSFAPGEFFGLSPESLAYGDMSEDDYLGHVFWDQETWMYSPFLLLQPQLAQSMLNTRLRVLNQARKNAVNNKVEGAQFPWEQGVSGIPVSPSDDCEKYELHINADISLAIRQLAYAIGSVSQELRQLAEELADFWMSRVTWLEEKKQFGIVGVMPPDEFNYPVDNSAYTNTAAKLSIQLPGELLSLFSSAEDASGTTSSVYHKRADSYDMYVPFDETLKYHPEFDGYDIKNAGHNIVKQADVVLMGFPLCAETSTIVRKNDLELYEKVTTPNGPAMTWSMFCVGHLELNETSRAEPLFDRQLAQCTQPFKVWSEYPNGKGAINFITGMGGFLQSLLFGFLGIRLEPTCLTIKPVLHSHWTRIRLTGASYQGARFDIDVRREVGETSAPGADIVTVVTQTSGDSSQYTITKSQCSDPCVTTFTVRKQTSTC